MRTRPAVRRPVLARSRVLGETEGRVGVLADAPEVHFEPQMTDDSAVAGEALRWAAEGATSPESLRYQNRSGVHTLWKAGAYRRLTDGVSP